MGKTLCCGSEQAYQYSKIFVGVGLLNGHKDISRGEEIEARVLAATNGRECKMLGKQFDREFSSCGPMWNIFKYDIRQFWWQSIRILD
jgi:hypothetical protein